jgi:hypothetical protein
MPIELNHRNVRDLAKNLRDKVGRDDIKHSEVISAIAASVGRRPDALMHELKNEGVQPSASEIVVANRDSDPMTQALYAKGFWKITGATKENARSDHAFHLVLKAHAASTMPELGLYVFKEDGVDGRNWRVQVQYGRAQTAEQTVLSSVGELLEAEVLKVVGDKIAARDVLWSSITNSAARYEYDDETCRTEETKHAEPETAADSRRIAKAAGFGVWDTGGGCQAFGMMLREEGTSNGDVACLELMITTNQGTSVNAAPGEPCWEAGVNYTDPRGGESLVGTEETLTLHEAIAKAKEFARQADRMWDANYDRDAIREHEGFVPRP